MFSYYLTNVLPRFQNILIKYNQFGTDNLNITNNTLTPYNMHICIESMIFMSKIYTMFFN